jgi:hypothetical protein
MALDKLLIAKKTIQDLEEQLRDCQKENLQNQHAIMTKDGLIKKQRDEISRLGADEATLIDQIRKNASTDISIGQDFEGDIDCYQKEIETLKMRLETDVGKAQQKVQQLEQKIKKVMNEKVTRLRVT